MRLTFVFWPSVRRHKHGVQDGAKTQFTDKQWDRIKALFPWEPPTRYGGRPPQASPRLPGRHPVGASQRCVLERTKACCRAMSENTRQAAVVLNSFPSFSTCWRRFKEWTAAGIFKVAWARLLDELDDLGEINWEEAMADGTFSPAKKGAPRSAKPNAVREPRSCCSSTARVCRWESTPTRPAPPK